MLMNTMEALGAGQALSPKGEAPGLSLGADAETLALFASMFAMMQTSQPGSANIVETSADNQAPQKQPGSEDGKPPLPAAATLMAGLRTSVEINDKTISLGEAGSVESDTAALMKLLLAAHDITASYHQPVAPATASDDSADVTTSARTATEMLTGAIEILKALETAPEAQSSYMALSADALPKEPAPIVMASRSSEFVGPMPLVTLSTLSTAPSKTMPSPLMVLQAEPEFIGPMPAVATLTTSSAPAVVVQSDPDFIGLLPEVEPSVARPLPVAVLHVDPGFIGPMPVVATPLQQTIAADSSSTLTHHAGTNTAPNLTTGLMQSGVIPNDLPREAEKTLMSRLSDVGLSDDSADKDEGFVRQRADMFTSGKGMVNKTAELKMAADIQTTRMAAMRAGAETSQASSTSSLASGLAQQMATSLTGGQASATNGQDTAQATANTAASTAGGESGTSSGGYSGGQSSGQQSAQQMADGGVSRGVTDRTLLHRLNTDNAGWSETMVKRLTADLRNGVQNVRIILEPRQLGRLNVELALRNGKASIRIAAETLEAAKLLSAARGQLGHMLENVGLRLAGFQATGVQADNTGLDSGQGSQGRGGDAAGDHDARNSAGRNGEFSNKMKNTLNEAANDVTTDENVLREGETAVLSILA